MKTIYTIEKNDCFQLVQSKRKAKAIDPSGYRIANVEDLRFWVASGYRPFRGLIKVKEGVYRWKEWKVYNSVLNEYDFKCDYIKVKRK